MIRELTALLRKELMLEWRQRFAINGLLLYVLSMVVVIALAFVDKLNPLTWNILFWIMILFMAINAVAKGFMGETTGQLLYLYTLARPAAIILAKMIYNFLLLTLLGGLTLVGFSTMGGQSLADPGLMILILVAGSAALSANLTLVTALASRAENRHTLLAVLSFPLLVPVLLLLVRLSRYAIEGITMVQATDSFVFLGGLVVIMAVVSVVLFPFLWRD